jgi:hypothetical protein
MCRLCDERLKKSGIKVSGAINHVFKDTKGRTWEARPRGCIWRREGNGWTKEWRYRWVIQEMVR